MGDVAMLVPVLRALLSQNQVRITLITKPQFAPIFLNIESLNLKTVDLRKSYSGLLGLWRLSKEIKSLKPDYFLDLHDVLRTKVLKSFFLLHRLKYRTFKKGRSEKKKRVAHFQASLPWLKSTHERYADGFRELGFNLELKSQDNFSGNINTVSSQVQSHLIELRPANGSLVGLAPFAAYPGKTYPIESTQILCKMLNELGHAVLLFGAAGHEQEALESLAKTCNRVYCEAGKWPFIQELELMSGLDLMIAMDSSNGHLATNFGLPVLTLWGVTHPSLGFAPYGQPKINQICVNRREFPMTPTSVYGNKLAQGCEHIMRSITPDQVLEKVQNILNQASS